MMKILHLLFYFMLLAEAGQAQSNRQQYLDSLTNVLAQSSVTTSHVGKAGKFSASYKTFLYLLSYATPEELYQYSQHDSATVSVYSCYALRYKRAPQRKSVKQRLLTNTNNVSYMRGCLKGTMGVNQIVQGKNSLYSRREINYSLKQLK